jgi:hypothetical protein
MLYIQQTQSLNVILLLNNPQKKCASNVRIFYIQKQKIILKKKLPPELR